MKTSRYKFDELWLVAINHTDMAPELAEAIIRNYIEEGVEPDPKMLTSGFVGVWTLIKAQIDQRKRRNLRARERRQERRQSDSTKSSMKNSEISTVDKAPSASRRLLPAPTSRIRAVSPAVTTESSSIPSSAPSSASEVSTAVATPSSPMTKKSSRSLEVSSPGVVISPVSELFSKAQIKSTATAVPSTSHTAAPSSSKKVPFASRFRGPGLGAIRRS